MVGGPHRAGRTVTAPRRRLLRFGKETLLVVIDMQRLFGEATAWRVPLFYEIVPAIARLVEHWPEQTVRTPSLTPRTAAATSGAWRDVYRRWPTVTLARMDRAMLDLIPELSRFVPPATVCDKVTYSAFESRAFLEILRRRRPERLA